MILLRKQTKILIIAASSLEQTPTTSDEGFNCKYWISNYWNKY